MNKKRGIRGFIAVMLSVLLLAGCGRIPKDDSGSPRPAVYVNDTIYMEIYEAEQSLPEGWEELGEIKYVLTNQQEMDESCKNYTANWTDCEIGTKLYANEKDDEKIYVLAGRNNYVVFAKYHEPKIYAQDALYVREGGYFGDSFEKELPDGWHKIGTLQKIVFQDEPMVKENFTGNDDIFMNEGGAVYGNEDVPDKIYYEETKRRYIPFVK